MKILCLAALPFPNRNGTQIYIAHLVQMLTDLGHQVAFLTYDGLHEALKPTDIAKDTKKTSLLSQTLRNNHSGPHISKIALDIALYKTAGELLKHWPADCIYAHNYEALSIGIVLKYKFKIPLVYHAHNIMSYELPSYFSKLLYKPLHMSGKAWDLLPQYADTVICFDQAHQHYLNRKKTSNNYVIIPPGLYPENPSWLYPHTKSPAIPEIIGEPYLLYTGNIDAYQSLPTLIQSMPLVWKEIPSCKLVLCTSERKERVARMVQSHTEQDENIIIHHVTSKDNLTAIFKNAALAICPRSVWWGYPIKAINALSLSTPLLGHAQALKPYINNDNAFLVHANKEDIASGIIQALQQPEITATKALNGQETFHQVFNLQQQQRQYLQVFPMVS